MSAETMAARAARLGVPVSAAFQITDRCNYRCAHCYEVHDEGSELSADEVERILGEMADAGVLYLTVTGGEVYMRRDIDRILEATRRLKFAVRLFTTGHFVDDARADRLKELAIQEVHMSLYGPDAATHEAVTLMPGSFERTVAAARRLRARGTVVVLKTPVMSVNVRRHRDLVALYDELGCKYQFDPNLTSREDGERSPLHLRPSQDDLIHFWSTFARANLEEAAAEGRAFDRATMNGETPCLIGQLACSINPQGLVFGCASLPLPVGDLRKQSFGDVWRHSSELHRLRSIKWGDIDVCSTCTARPWCHRCHAMALLEDGKLLGPSTEACRHAVAVRESLRARGLIPVDTPRDLPLPLAAKGEAPTQIDEQLAYGFRPAGLRVIQ